MGTVVRRVQAIRAEGAFGSGAQVSTTQRLAEMVLDEKNRCLLPAGYGRQIPPNLKPDSNAGRDSFRDKLGDNRVRVNRDVVYT